MKNTPNKPVMVHRGFFVKLQNIYDIAIQLVADFLNIPTQATLSEEKMRTELYEMEENSTITAIRQLIDEKLTSIALARKPFFTTKEVAKYLGLTEAYIRKMTHNREIPHYNPLGKNLYFNRDEIDEGYCSRVLLQQTKSELKQDNVEETYE